MNTYTVLQQGKSGRQCGKLGQSSMTQMLMTAETKKCYSALHSLRSTSVRTWSYSLHISSHSHLAQVESCPHFTSISRHIWLSLFVSTYTLHFTAFLLSVFLFPFFHLSDEQQPELNKKIMENLCDSANNWVRAPTTYSTSPQVMSPTAMTSTSSRTHQVPLSFKIPAADQDVDDLTLCKMLTEAYRGQVDYFVQGGVSVSQLLSSVRSDRSGQPHGGMIDRSGKPDECNISKAQIRTLFEEHRQTIIAEYREKVTNSKQFKPKKSADSFKDNQGNREWNFVKLINKVLQKW